MKLLCAQVAQVNHGESDMVTTRTRPIELREIARTMKPGAPVSVQTFVAGNTVINRFTQKRSWLHTFELAELQHYLTEAGFEGFRPELDGIVLTFSARKATPRI